MDVFVARQPILDVDQALFGYELLFRSGPENLFGDYDPDAASSQLIDNSASVFDLDSLTAGKRAFVNVTRRVLTQDLVSSELGEAGVVSSRGGRGEEMGYSHRDR